MPLVFVNYRNNDEATATLLDQHLKRFGSNAVFRASKSIQPGDDYRERLLSGTAQRSAARRHRLRWLDATTEQGGRKLDDPHDWVRQEILEALAPGAGHPVLVGDVHCLCKLASAIGAPNPLRYLRFSHRNADADLARVAEVAKVTGNRRRLNLPARVGIR